MYSKGNAVETGLLELRSLKDDRVLNGVKEIL